MIQIYKEPEILVVEDDDVDFMAISRCFEQMKLLNIVHRADDGIEALEILRGGNKKDAVTKPYIILLDLNMPRMNGLEFLAEIRHDGLLRDSVIFVLTTSKSDEDRVAAYRKNVAGYIVKSNLKNGFIEVLSMLDNYCRIVLLPY